MNPKRISWRGWRPNWRPNSSASAPTRWRPSSPSRWWAPPPDACRRRKAISAPCATSATGTARCLILDEVMCGMGRTGTLHAWEQEGIAPDIQAIAKGLGGGYQPIGAMLASGRIIDTIRQGSGAFQHGHTYLAHPLACAAALEVQRIIGEEHLLDRVKELGAHLERRLTERFGNHRHVGDIRGPRPVPGHRTGRRSRHARRRSIPRSSSTSGSRPRRSKAALPAIRRAERWTAAAAIMSCSRRPISRHQTTST